MSIYVCSDLHFNHTNILGFCRSNFATIEEHNEYIIRQYNSVVGKDDLVYILGDIGFTPEKALSELVKRLNGRKILLVGNHDKLTDREYRAMGFIDVVRHPIYYNTHIILSHVPIEEAYNSEYIINVHGHLHKNHIVNLPNFFNVNVELNDYKPINMEVFEKQAERMCLRNRWAPFGKEWYAQWETERNKV